MGTWFKRCKQFTLFKTFKSFNPFKSFNEDATCDPRIYTGLGLEPPGMVVVD